MPGSQNSVVLMSGDPDNGRGRQVSEQRVIIQCDK